MANRTILIRWLAVAVALCLCAVYAGSVVAATRYVSDQLSINMRRGPGNQYKIDKLLDAGEKLETLNSKSGWTRVRLSSGETGYVLTRFLSDEPAARTQLAGMKKRVDSLQSTDASLKKQLSQLQQNSGQLSTRKTELEKENKSLRNQLQDVRAASADAVRISKQNKTYRGEIMKLKASVERLKHENASLQSRRDGMTIGALILFGGIILGLILPLFRRRSKRGGWDSL